MIRERPAVAHPLLKKSGVIFVSIDENERADLEHALSDVFGRENRVEELIWVQNTTHSQSPTYSTNHEYVEVFAKDKLATMQEASMYREPKPGYVELQDLDRRLNAEYPPIVKVEQEIQAAMTKHLAEYKEELGSMGFNTTPIPGSKTLGVGSTTIVTPSIAIRRGILLTHRRQEPTRPSS